MIGADFGTGIVLSRGGWHRNSRNTVKTGPCELLHSRIGMDGFISLLLS